MTPISVELQNPHGKTYELEPVSLTQTRIGCDGKSIVVGLGLPDVVARWGRWTRGAMVQTAFSPLPAAEREFLITAITAQEWREIFADEAEA